MLSVLISVQIIDGEAETLWTEARLMASDDADLDVVDISFPDAVISAGDNVMFDPVELRRALSVVARERVRHLAEAA